MMQTTVRLQHEDFDAAALPAKYLDPPAGTAHWPRLPASQLPELTTPV